VRPAYSQARIPPRRAPPTSSLSLTLSCAVLAFHESVALGRRLDRMGRNRGFTAALIQIQREAERQRNAELVLNWSRPHDQPLGGKGIPNGWRFLDQNYIGKSSDRRIRACALPMIIGTT
jgi:hypothetical protein